MTQWGGRFPQIQKAVIIRENKCPQFENCSLKHIFSKADQKLKDTFARFRVNKELVFQMHEELPRASDTEISEAVFKRLKWGLSQNTDGGRQGCEKAFGLTAQREMLVETMVRHCNLSTSKNNGDVKNKRCQRWE